MTRSAADAGSRILLVGPAWVGDIVMSHTLVRTMSGRRPDAIIDVLTPDWAVPLVARMPGVRRAIPLEIGHGQLGLARRWRVARALRGECYDQAIVVKRTLKSALIPALARIPRRTGVRGEMRFGLINDMRDIDAAETPLNHHRYALLGVEPGETLDREALLAPALRVDADNRRAALGRLELDERRPAIGFAPGAAYGSAKRWPEHHWIRLASDIVRNGHQVWIFGSEAERGAADAIVSAVDEGVVSLAGRTSLPDVVDLSTMCRAFVSNDSGLMHVAAAAGAYVVALFGSTSPLNTPPLTLRGTVLWRRLDCSPCFARTCPLGHLDCLEGIDPAQVREACFEAVTGTDRGPSRSIDRSGE